MSARRGRLARESSPRDRVSRRAVDQKGSVGTVREVRDVRRGNSFLQCRTHHCITLYPITRPPARVGTHPECETLDLARRRSRASSVASTAGECTTLYAAGLTNWS